MSVRCRPGHTIASTASIHEKDTWYVVNRYQQLARCGRELVADQHSLLGVWFSSKNTIEQYVDISDAFFGESEFIYTHNMGTESSVHSILQNIYSYLCT